MTMKRFFLAVIFLVGAILVGIELFHEATSSTCHFEKWKWIIGGGLMIAAAWAEQEGFGKVFSAVTDAVPLTRLGRRAGDPVVPTPPTVVIAKPKDEPEPGDV